MDEILQDILKYIASKIENLDASDAGWVLEEVMTNLDTQLDAME